MSLNKEDPEIIELAKLCARYGHRPKPEEAKLRCIRYIMFDTYLNQRGIKDKFLERGFSTDPVDETLKWLVENGIANYRGDGTYRLTDDFAKLVVNNMPKLVNPIA